MLFGSFCIMSEFFRSVKDKIQTPGPHINLCLDWDRDLSATKGLYFNLKQNLRGFGQLLEKKGLPPSPPVVYFLIFQPGVNTAI